MSNAKVTLRDVYEITDRIEGKLDKMESRISALELWRAELTGRITVIVGLISLAFTMAWDYVRRKLTI